MAFVVVTGDLTGNVTEDLALSTAGSVSMSSGPPTGLFVAGTFAGRLGTLTINAAGAWSYELDNGNPAVQALGAGMSDVDTFVATWNAEEVIQGFIEITVQGQNDPGTFTGDASAVLDATEAGGISGLMVVQDPDVGQKEFQAAVDLPGAVGTLTIAKSGAWQYTLLPGQQTAIVDERKAIVETFNVASVDGTVTTVTVFVTTDETTAPAVSALLPADDATGVAPDSDLVVTFDEPVRRGSGDIVIRTAGGSVVATFDAASSAAISFSGSQLRIDPPQDLAANTAFVVQIEQGAVLDLAGNAYAGTNGYNFTTGTSQGQQLPGTAGDDNLVGGAGNDSITGLAGRDILTGGGGNDTLDGGAGIDTAVYAGLRASYTVTGSGASLGVQSAGEGTDVVVGVERLQFSDVNLAFDLDGQAGLTARLLGTVFGSAYVGNPALVGLGLELLAGGMSFDALMQLALDVRFGAGASNEVVVAGLYANVIGVVPDAAAIAPFVDLIESGAMSQAGLAVIAANTPYAATAIGLDALAASGLAFT